MEFKIKALNHQEFEPLFKLSDTELDAQGMQRMLVDEKPGFPCRVSLVDAEIGEEVILLSYEFHKAKTPYKSKGPIFVRKGLKTASFENNEIPLMLHHRLLSYRGYDKNCMMRAAKTEKGADSKKVIEDIFGNSKIEYIHIHNSSPGCFNCEVRRIDA